MSFWFGIVEGGLVSPQAEVTEGQQVCSVAVARFLRVETAGEEERVVEKAIVEVVVDEMPQLGIHARGRRHGSIHVAVHGASDRVEQTVVMMRKQTMAAVSSCYTGPGTYDNRGGEGRCCVRSAALLGERFRRGRQSELATRGHSAVVKAAQHMLPRTAVCA